VTATVLVVNSGSSSIKYRVIEPASATTLAAGIVERIGEDGSRVEHRTDEVAVARKLPVPDHREGMQLALAMFDEVGPPLDELGIVAVGHRVVMGGRYYDGPTVIDDDVIATVERLAPLAPLHNPPNLVAIRIGRELLPDVPHVAVFDTAFFRDLPDAAATYALDLEVAERHRIRRYGFHGTSHQYVSATAAEVLGRDLAELRQIVLHLGNGASASAIVGGRPVDTSMGMTPLEGLVMGTRTGDIDPAITFHLARTAGMTVDEIDHLFNHRSGLRGLAGHNDMREVHRRIAAGDRNARLALDVYVHRLRKYIGAYTAIMGGLDVLVFTAGVGENDPVVRAEATAGLDHLGITVDPERNAAPVGGARVISPDGAAVTVMVVPTDEELAIARQAIAVV
jgi:acetate kinase